MNKGITKDLWNQKNQIRNQKKQKKFIPTSESYFVQNGIHYQKAVSIGPRFTVQS